MRHDDELSGGEVLLWTALGVGAGLLAAFALSEWVGDVNRARVRRVAAGSARAGRPGSPRRLGARRARSRCDAEPRLAGLRSRPGR